jgi:hypothetical protein
MVKTMRLKSGVRVSGVSLPIVVAMIVVNEIMNDMDLLFTVTSLCDSKHSDKSKHYIGAAMDIRVNSIPSVAQVELLQQQIMIRLSNEYDVVLEGRGTANAHIHIEFDPK